MKSKDNKQSILTKNVYIIVIHAEDRTYIYITKYTSQTHSKVKLFAPIEESQMKELAPESEIVTFDTKEEAEKQCEIFNETLSEYAKKRDIEPDVAKVMKVKQIISIDEDVKNE